MIASDVHCMYFSPMRFISILTILITSLASQAQEMEKHVVHKYPNGGPKVVVYVDPDSKERLKEEIYYSNGRLDYVGHYKNGKEDGKWTYYWENGNLKSEEFYVRGEEHGILFDYNEEGKAIKRYEYKRGELITEQVLPGK